MADKSGKKVRSKEDDEVSGRDGEAVSPELPVSIITDILVRLPVKTLLRFKCVSRPWRSLISDPSFASSFLARSLARPAVTSLVSISDLSQPGPSLCQFFRLDHQTGLCAPVPLPDMPSDTAEISEGIHGFICLDDGGLTCVCNPSTREVAALPLTSPDFPDDLQGEMSSFATLGYDSASKQYKVLKTWNLYSPYGGVAAAHKVLTLGTNSWRTVDDCPIKFPWDDCISEEGAIHILTRDSMRGNIVGTLDLASEKFRMLLLPEGVRAVKVELKLFRGHLALLECRRLWDDDTITLYVLDDYRSRAWKELRMVLPRSWKEDIGFPPRSLRISIPHNGSGDILLIPTIIYKQSEAYLFSYNVESKRMKKVQIHGPPFHIFYQYRTLSLECRPFDLVDNILSLNHV
ncbi:hypothetical protein ACJRO7_016800 [Eucalyptus globulus]|uniref:F-box domain-containing protein n=1 Tax=Eucalyptus globulus TaxID=34317 RepID=A0ABD3KPE3_EUCGL